MSVHAGQLLHVGGLSLIDRVQSAGLGTVKVPVDTVREVGNDFIVEKVPQEPDFTFTLESFDMSAELEALVMGTAEGQGEVGSGPLPNQRPGHGDADGTVYRWSNTGFINICSPWKDGLSSSGVIAAGHLIPGYAASKLSYKFGVTENSSQTVELSGASFYYAGNAPVEEYFAGDGATTAFTTAEAAVPYRIGGAGGTTFKSAFGVIVNGVLQAEGVDYISTPANSAVPAAVTITFTKAPKAGTRIRVAYFTTTSKAFPDTDLAAASVKPGAVRGRHICVTIHPSSSGVAATRIGTVQTFQLDATVNQQIDRELCNTEIVGRSVLGYDCTGTFVVRAKDTDTYLDLLSKATGVSSSEVIGWLNTNPVGLEVAILNPKNPGETLKTIWVPDAIIQPPGTEAKVNSPTDFSFAWESQTGDFLVYKGAKP